MIKPWSCVAVSEKSGEQMKSKSRPLAKNTDPLDEVDNRYLKKNIPEKVVVYIHTPKTAGTYLREAWLLGNVDNYFWLGYKNASLQTIEHLQSDYIEASRYELLGGHMNINTFLKMKTIQPRIFLNVLREPVSRILSFYNFIKNINKNHPAYEEVKKYTLFKLLNKKGKFYELVHNAQIRQLTANRQLIKNFSDRDALIVGRQDRLSEFISIVNNLVGFQYGSTEVISKAFNKGEEGYIEKIKLEPNYQEALQILKEMTQQESELYNSIENVTVMGKREYRDFVQKYQREKSI